MYIYVLSETYLLVQKRKEKGGEGVWEIAISKTEGFEYLEIGNNFLKK